MFSKILVSGPGRLARSSAPGFESHSGHSNAGFVLGYPEFKFSAMLVNNQMVTSFQLGFL